MFDEPKPNQPAPSKEPEDIFAKTEPTKAEGKEPSGERAVAPRPRPEGGPAPTAAEARRPSSAPRVPEKEGAPSAPPPPPAPKTSWLKVVIGLVVVLVVLGGLAAGGWYIYNTMFVSPPSPEPAPMETETEPEMEANTNQAATPPEEEQVPEEPLDTDGDGLTDEEERSLGTDINNSDTDGDDLFDRDEVMVYETDPLDPDSDGDGYTDGEEVENGYDPLGPGKLLDINNAISQ